jgi:hypothetical protein
MQQQLPLPPLITETSISYGTPESIEQYEMYWKSLFNNDLSLLDKMRSQIRIFTPSEYENGIDFIASKINDIQKTNPVVLVHQAEGRSGAFVRQSLNRTGIQPDFPDFVYNKLIFPITYPEQARAICIDDAYFRFGELGGFLNIFREQTDYSFPSEHIFTAVVGGTDHGIKRATSKFEIPRQNIFRYYGIPVLDEILSDDELKLIQRTFKDREMHLRYLRKEVLSFFYFKISDQFFRPFSREAQVRYDCPYYLVDDTQSGPFPTIYSRKD